MRKRAKEKTVNCNEPPLKERNEKLQVLLLKKREHVRGTCS